MSLFSVSPGMVHGLRAVHAGGHVRNVKTFGTLWHLGLIEPPKHLKDETRLTDEGQEVLEAAADFERRVSAAIQAGVARRKGADR